MKLRDFWRFICHTSSFLWWSVPLNPSPIKKIGTITTPLLEFIMFETQVNCHQPAAFLFILLTLIFNKKFLLIFFFDNFRFTYTYSVFWSYSPHHLLLSLPHTLWSPLFPNILPPNSVSSNVNSPLPIIRLAYVRAWVGVLFYSFSLLLQCWEVNLGPSTC